MQFQKHFFLLFLLLVLSACNRQEGDQGAEQQKQNKSLKKPLRFGMVTGLKPEKVAYYMELHANTWEGVLKAIRQFNIRNYSIYVHEIEGKPYLFGYYEYVGDNYEEDMKKIAADSVTRRWWMETDPCQIALPEAAANGKIWTNMEEVFHTD